MNTTAWADLVLASLAGGTSWAISDTDEGGLRFLAGLLETLQYAALILMAKAVGL